MQSVYNLVHLYRRPGVYFKIFCSNADLDQSILGGVLFDEWVDHNAYTQVMYVSKSRQTVAHTRAIVQAVPHDVLFVNGIYSFYFNFLPLLFSQAPRKIIAPRGMLHSGALSQKSLKKHLYLASWKLLGIHRRNIFHASNSTEGDFTRKVFGNSTPVMIAANLPRVFDFQQVAKEAGVLRLVSVALISPMKNYLEVLKALAHCKSRIFYAIYGPVKDPAYWELCKEQIGRLPGHIKVIYKGESNAGAIEAALGSQEVFIMPSKSENFGHAIFEALSAGKPVITSHNTPWNELSAAKAGINVAVTGVEEIVAAIEFFAGMSNADFSDWNRGARAFALRRFDIEASLDEYDRLFGVTTPTG